VKLEENFNRRGLIVSSLDRPDGLGQGIPTEGRPSTLDLLIKVGSFVKRKMILSISNELI
jgi:hypothetical protein